MISRLRFNDWFVDLLPMDNNFKIVASQNAHAPMFDTGWLERFFGLYKIAQLIGHILNQQIFYYNLYWFLLFFVDSLIWNEKMFTVL